MSKIKLLVIDLDGTTLKPGQVPYVRFNDKFANFLDAFVAHGGAWAINSAWSVVSQWDLVISSPLQSRPVFLMGELGRQLAESDSTDFMMLEPYTTQIQRDVEEWGDRYWKDFFKLIHATKSGLASMYFSGFLVNGRVKKAVELYDMLARCREVCDTVNIIQRGDSFELYPSLISKGRALAEVVMRMGVSPDEVAVAGDAVADMSMFDPALCSYPLCPENAAQEVQDYVLSRGGIVGKGIAYEGVIDAITRMGISV